MRNGNAFQLVRHWRTNYNSLKIRQKKVLKQEKNMPNNFPKAIPDFKQSMKTISMFKDEYLLDFINTENLGQLCTYLQAMQSLSSTIKLEKQTILPSIEAKMPSKQENKRSNHVFRTHKNNQILYSLQLSHFSLIFRYLQKRLY